MTLYGTILKRVQSKESAIYIPGKYSSPPPETEIVVVRKKKKTNNQYDHVKARVDSAPPALQARDISVHLPLWGRQQHAIFRQNMSLLCSIRRQHFTRGKVDSRWTRPLKPALCQSFDLRSTFMKQTVKENKQFYKMLNNTKPRIVRTASLNEDWKHNRRLIIDGALNDFVLFDPHPKELMEDGAFLPAKGVKRPRVQITLGIAGCASLGCLTVELFCDVCPRTCDLFLALADGDGLGHGYVGTRLFTKVPGLYCAGGDVIHDNGFGCYAQRGRLAPIGAENYHFSHSMPGLLSMRMTCNNEMCGVFNITFKALPQFDLKNVVFGRVIRPCATYDALGRIGAPLSPRPVVVVTGTRRFHHETKSWIRGEPNTRIQCGKC